MRGENRKRTTIDFVKHQFDIDLTEPANRKYGTFKGNINVPEKIAEQLRRRGADKYFYFANNGGLGMLMVPKEESLLVNHAEKMKKKAP